MNDIIKERYCSVGVALLLKEKGMNKKNLSHYIQKNNEDGTSEIVSTCTHQVATDWLRIKHGIEIIVFHEMLPNDCYWARIETYPYTVYQQEPIYEEYEHSEDDAILYALENLI